MGRETHSCRTAGIEVLLSVNDFAGIEVKTCLTYQLCPNTIKETSGCPACDYNPDNSTDVILGKKGEQSRERQMSAFASGLDNF